MTRPFQSILKVTPKSVGLILGPLLFLCTLLFVNPDGLSKEGIAVLATTLWVAIWWTTESVPLAITSLLPIILFPLMGAMELQETTSSYGHRYIFLYIGGFILALTIERWNLHKRIALIIINLIGTNISSIILGFMIATAFLSMWISNTATSVLMLPIAMAIVKQMDDNPATVQNETTIFGKALMLSIAYSASIGGIATIIGTPPNLVLASIVQDTYGHEITFLTWLKFGLPISVVTLGICWWYITRRAFSFSNKAFPGGRSEIRAQLTSLGPISYEEKMVLSVFAITALAWITRSFLLNRFLPALDDTIIAVISATVLFLLPTDERSRSLITWDEAVKLPWGILLLFGGGLAIASGFQSSGLATWIGSQLTLLEGLSLIIVVVIIIASVNFLTEITSNLATTAMILPILGPIAFVLGVHPFVLMVSATVAASFAFMLPVATPPNAVVFGAGYLRIPDMIQKGIWMNLISIVILTLFCYWLLPALWDFSPTVFPSDWIE